MQGAGVLEREGEAELEEVRAGQAEGALPYGPSSSSAARLLRMDPPAACLHAAASGPLAVRLLLHSPAPQLARVLVLAERQGRGGAVPPRAVLLCEVAVTLEGGVQEMEVQLGAGELAGVVEGGGLPDGVRVLRVVLVGPVRVPQGAESGQQQGPCPAPLVHWVAPPLLLVPEGAAGELCSLWEQMKREQEDGQNQEQPSLATPNGSLYRAVAPTGPAAAALAGIEQESSLWWFHMGPLMADLAYVLTDGVWQEADREEVLSHLLPFLHDNGMQHTAAFLQPPNEARPSRNTSNNGAPRPLSLNGAGRPPLPRHPLPYGPDWTRLAAPCAGLTAAFPSCRGLLTRIRQLRVLPSISPFSPPALELSYQAWRLAGLAATAPYVLLATAQPLLLGLANAVAQHGIQHAMRMAPLAILNWVSESACRIMLLRLAALRMGGRRGGAVALPPAAESAVASAVRRYTLAGVVLGPSVAVAASLAVALGLLPYFDNYVGNQRAVLIASLHRSLLLPSLQRLPVRQLLAASPLLAASEALQLAALQPAWGWRRVACYVAAWRLVAAAVAAAWECRSRRRFAALVVQEHGQAGGAGCAAAGGGGGMIKQTLYT